VIKSFLGFMSNSSFFIDIHWGLFPA